MGMTIFLKPNVRLKLLTRKKFTPQAPMRIEGVLDEWVEHFPKDAKFLRSISKNLNRSKVRKICGKRSKNSTRQKFLAVMLWGYGPYAVGATRTLEITKELNFDNKLIEIMKLARGGRHIDAVSYMATNPIRGLGPAYGTKLVYFCSPKTVCAPIYDKRIRDWLNKYAANELSGARLSKIQWHTNSYVAWSHWLQVQAALLGRNWEDLEYLMFEDAKSIGRSAKTSKRGKTSKNKRSKKYKTK